jgi:hypothetical protein
MKPSSPQTTKEEAACPEAKVSFSCALQLHWNPSVSGPIQVPRTLYGRLHLDGEGAGPEGEIAKDDEGIGYQINLGNGLLEATRVIEVCGRSS